MVATSPIPWRLVATSALADSRALIVGGGASPVVDCQGCERLPLSLLIAAGGASLTLTRASTSVRAFARRCQRPRLLVDEPAPPAAMPFAVETADPAGLRVSVEANAGQHAGLAHPEAHDWAGGVEAPYIDVAMERVSHVNSVLVAWLLQVAQQARPGRLRVAGASPAVVTQLKQLRLDHLMTLA